METILALLIPALMTMLLVRWILLPVRGLCRMVLHWGCGFLSLWLLNTLAPITGILLPMNAVTVLTAGTLGLPGIGLLVLLSLL